MNITSIEDYKLFEATDIKSFIIEQLKAQDNDVFKDVNYIGSNLNTFIDTISVILQQLLFHLSLSTSETAFSTAQLYESMNKIVSLLNYKPTGKQTSLLPVRMTVTKESVSTELTKVTIPRFFQISHNTNYVLKDEISVTFGEDETVAYVDAVMFQGLLKQSQIFEATGDEFEKITLLDEYIQTSQKFVSDGFFFVFVREVEDEKWHMWTETSSIFLCDGESRKYERRFTEDYDYEFKFGNNINGRRLQEGDRIAIFYVLSNGEESVIGNDEIVSEDSPTTYTTSLYSTIMNDLGESYDDLVDFSFEITNSGPSSDITYPESVESIRSNAPKAFVSQNRLFTLEDYKRFISTKFSSYCKGVYMMTNDTYTSDYLRYYYDLGLDSPNKDARINVAQVNFMTSCDFNNVYAVILPSLNTIVSDRVPNYLNMAFKQEIVSSVEPYKGLTHNLVILDPLYKAFTFGSTKLDDEVFNTEQLQNKLVLKKNKRNKYSNSYIKQQAISVFSDYFGSLELGESVDVTKLTTSLNEIQGVSDFYIEDIYGNKETMLTFYTWNPLYNTDDNKTTQQTEKIYEFQFCYFYDLENISNLIEIEDE